MPFPKLMMLRFQDLKTIAMVEKFQTILLLCIVNKIFLCSKVLDVVVTEGIQKVKKTFFFK